MFGFFAAEPTATADTKIVIDNRNRKRMADRLPADPLRGHKKREIKI